MTSSFKKLLLWSLIIIATTIPLATLTTCNIRTSREIKNNELDSSVWKSNEWKKLEKMIQKKFKKEVIRDMFANYVYHNTNPFIVKKLRLAHIARAKTKQEIDRIFLEEKRLVGNYATDTLKRVLYEIRANKLISNKYKLLLNKISTIYNRTINMYPTKIFHKKIENDQYLHIEFRADLLTPMKRRFVQKFLEIKFDFPIFDKKYSQKNLRKFYKITQFKNPVKLAQEIKTGSQMLNIWLSTITNNQGIRAEGNGIIDATNAKDLLGIQQLLNLNSGFYPLNFAKNDWYTPRYTGRINDPSAPKSYTFANYAGTARQEIAKDLKHPNDYRNTRILYDYVYPYLNLENNKEFVTLKNTDKVSKLEEAIKEQFFTNSKMPLFKALFGPQGNWKIKVEAQTWAGNPASNYTIADWVENIGHRGNFFFYMINRNDDTESYHYSTRNGMAKVQEVN